MAKPAPGALVFFDIKAASYSILPEMALGAILSDVTRASLLQKLGFYAEEINLFEESFTSGSLRSQEHGLDQIWVSALADWSTRSWLSVAGDAARVYQLTGTRPGHPTADLVFNFVFAVVQLKLVSPSSRPGRAPTLR